MASNSTSEPLLVNDTGIPFVHPGEILSEAIVLPILGIIAVLLRFYMRRSNGQGIKADDWTILAALPFTLGMAAMMIYGVAERAVGYPSPPYPVAMSSLAEEKLLETTPQQDVVFIVYWVTWLLMIPANGFIKLSAILMYRRVFVVNKWSPFDIVTKVMFVVCLLWTIGFFFAQVFGCGNDFYKPFGNLEEVASCNTNVRLNGLMVSDLLTDIIVWIMPFPVVWTLHMSMTRKLTVTGILLLATMSIVAAAIRLKIELGIASGGYSVDIDDNQVLTLNIYWSNIESGLALVAACLPTLRLATFRQRLGSTIHSLQGLLATKHSKSTTAHSDEQESKKSYSMEHVTTKKTSTASGGYRSHEQDHSSTLGIEEDYPEHRPQMAV